MQTAYPRLKREWPGLAVRQHMPRVPGWPDFILLWRGTVIFAEVKWEENPLDPLQRVVLDRLTRHGGRCVVIRCFASGWRVETGPFLPPGAAPGRSLTLLTLGTQLLGLFDET